MELVKAYGIIVVLGTMGLAICGYGIWQVVKPTEPVVEIIRNQELGDSNQLGNVFVDVAGAVEKPGVYKLASGSRIGDVLVTAGGLAASADREWVAKTLNLAEEVKDGEKLYIPALQEYKEITNSNNQIPNNFQIQKNQLININEASQGELESLNGIGEARAKAIIAGRPYGSTGEIVEKAKIPESVYEKIKDQIRVY